MPRRALLALGVLVAALTAAPAALGAEIAVTTAADGIAADGACSLREAVIAARDDAPFQGCAAGAGADTIRLDAQVYVLSLPGAGEGASMTGDLDLGAQSLRIMGKGAAVTAIDASGLDRAFDLLEGASLALEDLTVRNGRTPQGDPGEEGGAVRSRGSVSALRTAFVGNSAGNGSSGVMGGGPIGGGGSGGAISTRLGSGPPPSLSIIDSSFIGNLAGDGGQFSGPGSGGGGNGGRGGAIEAIGGTVAISGSTFAGNLAGDGGNGGTGPVTPGAGGGGGVGGAIYAAFGSVAITNSTFAANRAGAGGLTGANPSMPARGGTGGAMFADSSVLAARAEFSTFSGNLRGPATFADGANGLAGGSAAGSILADPAPACQNVAPGPLRNVALPGDPSCAGARLDGDPRLGPLTANGGPTLTLAPGPGSAAIDALAGAACPAADQRGLPRPQLGGCDAGAVEVQPGAAGGAPGARGGTTAARRISGLRLRPAAFRAAGSGASVGAAVAKSLPVQARKSLPVQATKPLLARAPIGTAVAYRLDGAARVRFTVRRQVPGRRNGRRCVRPGVAPPGARRCLRKQILRGSFAHSGAAGQNAFRFTGRLRGRKLVPGRYTLFARLPRPATGRAAVAARAFRIVR